MTVSLAHAKEISIDDIVAAVLSQLDVILTLKEVKEQHWRLFFVENMFLLNSHPVLAKV